MPKDKDTIRLRHMLDAAPKVLVFTVGWSRQDLDTDKMLARLSIKLSTRLNLSPTAPILYSLEFFTH